MKRILAWGVGCAIVLTGLILARASDRSPAGQSTQLEHGKYLVNNVAGCNDCTRPTDKGILDDSKYLQGAVLIFKPTVDMPWAPMAPRIIGLPMLSEKDGVVFLMTGKLPGGAVPRPPMPQFRLNKADAEAVVAYLKSRK